MLIDDIEELILHRELRQHCIAYDLIRANISSYKRHFVSVKLDCGEVDDHWSLGAFWLPVYCAHRPVIEIVLGIEVISHEAVAPGALCSGQLQTFDLAAENAASEGELIKIIDANIGVGKTSIFDSLVIAPADTLEVSLIAVSNRGGDRVSRVAGLGLEPYKALLLCDVDIYGFKCELVHFLKEYYESAVLQGYFRDIRNLLR